MLGLKLIHVSGRGPSSMITSSHYCGRSTAARVFIYRILDTFIPEVDVWLHPSQILLYLNTLRLSQNGCHFKDHILKCISLYGNFRILNPISLKYVPCRNDNMAAFGQNWWQAIIWSNAGMFCWCIYVSLRHKKLTDLNNSKEHL